jgi:hypothetical protein
VDFGREGRDCRNHAWLAPWGKKITYVKMES